MQNFFSNVQSYQVERDLIINGRVTISIYNHYPLSDVHRLHSQVLKNFKLLQCTKTCQFSKTIICLKVKRVEKKSQFYGKNTTLIAKRLASKLNFTND